MANETVSNAVYGVLPSAEYGVLLYYMFVPISDPAAFADEHRRFCRELGLKGRILVAPEGLNGTCSGPMEACQAYMSAMHADPRFADMVFKIDPSEGHAFAKLFVRTKAELVTFRSGVDHDPAVKTGRHLSPKEFHRLLQEPDTIVIDGRSDYEYEIGHFRGAVRPPLATFREFPEWIRNTFADRKDAKIITYCTGGIRCEKLTAFMLEEGFTDVAQLDGGIVTYGKDEEVRGSLWDGKCYVFDERVVVEINHTADKRIVAHCHHCQQPAERYVNCANLRCHEQHIACEACERAMRSCCSEACIRVLDSETGEPPSQPPLS